MDELIELVVEKTGIPAGTAKVAVETVVKFLKDKLPAPIAAQLDGLLEGGDFNLDSLGDLGDLGDLAKGLGNLFGK